MSEEPIFQELGNNTLLINHAGYGSTPECPQAKFKPGNIVKVRRHKARGVPQLACVAIVVPPNFPAEYALADFHKKPRPLMITGAKRFVQYIVGFDGIEQPHLFAEHALIATKHPDAEVGWK